MDDIRDYAAETATAEESPLALERRDLVFAVGALVVSVVWAVCGLFGGFALGYTLTAVLALVLFTAYFARGGRVSASALLCGVLALALGAVFICTRNGGVRFFAVVAGFLLALVSLDGFVRGAAVGNRRTAWVFLTAAGTLGRVGTAMRALFSRRDGDRRTVFKVLIGLACALPVLTVVVPLLLRSDDAFRGMMDTLFSGGNNTLLKAVVGLVVCPFVIAYGFAMKKGLTAVPPRRAFAGVESVYVVSFLSTVSVCYLMYLFSQFAYFFSAFSGFLPNGGITYAEYARKGFFEMCAIAVINLLLVFGATLLARRKNGKPSGGVRSLATFIGVFTLVIIATAISKMVLYIDAYGMTVKRLTTSAFMLFLAVVFVSVMLHLFAPRVNIVKTALITAGCVLLLLGVGNVNRVCAWYNYESYRAGRLDTVDVEAMYALGDEGIEYVARLAGADDDVVAQEARRHLAKAYVYDYFDDVQDYTALTPEWLQQHRQHKGLNGWSIPRERAYTVLYECLADNPDMPMHFHEWTRGDTVEDEPAFDEDDGYDEYDEYGDYDAYGDTETTYTTTVW